MYLSSSKLGETNLANMSHLVPWVAVKTLLETLLIQGMANKTNGSRKHEQPVQVADLNDVLDLGLPADPITFRLSIHVARHCITSKRELQGNNIDTYTQASQAQALQLENQHYHYAKRLGSW